MFPGITIKGKNIYTTPFSKNTVYGEKIIESQNGALREWNPFRSKLAAAILNGLKECPVKPGADILYLGASTGTTPSHVSDIVGEGGHVYALEYSETSIRRLLDVASSRPNMSALLGDARNPDPYKYLVGNVNVIYQDVAQPDQVDIIKKNAREFLNKGDPCLLCLKARSIDVSLEPTKIFKKVEADLLSDFKIKETIELVPYDKDHRFYFLEFLG